MARAGIYSRNACGMELLSFWIQMLLDRTAVEITEISYPKIDDTVGYRHFLFGVATVVLSPYHKGSLWICEYKFKYSNLCASHVAS